MMPSRKEETSIYATKMIPQSKDHKKYFASRRKEIDGLIDRGVFMSASLSEERGHRIYGSLFVDYVKDEGTPEAYEKSRFILQGFYDEQTFLTHAPTVMLASQRLLLSVAPADGDLQVKNRDVDEAFAQTKSKLRRKVYTSPRLPARIPIPGHLPHILDTGISYSLVSHIQRPSQGQA